MIRFTDNDGRVTFEVIVQPRAGRSQVVGERDGALKIKIAAPPVEGQANDECERFLANVLGLRRSDIEIVSGATSRKKLIRLSGLNGAEFAARLAILLSPPSAHD
jgi:hypothetical protein